jgi:DNA-binding response OmpR family regulator
METNKKIVVVEDDVMLSSILIRHLTDQHIESRLITTGEGAFQSIKEDLPDLVVLDLFLPVVNGLEILEMIRKDAVTKDLKVLVLSNSWESKNAETVATLGAPFLMKAAVSPTIIVEQIKKMLT